MATPGAAALAGSQICDATVGIADRLARLIERADGDRPVRPAGWFHFLVCTAVVPLPLVLCVAATTDQAQAAVHALAEALVGLG